MTMGTHFELHQARQFDNPKPENLEPQDIHVKTSAIYTDCLEATDYFMGILEVQAGKSAISLWHRTLIEGLTVVLDTNN